MTDLPPSVSAADELTTVDTAYGPMEKWKARALAIGWFQRVVETVRADAAAIEPSPLSEEQQPPAVVADAIDPELLQAIEMKIDELAARLDRFTRMKQAENALLQIEEAMESGQQLN
jgi:hypothetical protein